MSSVRTALHTRAAAAEAAAQLASNSVRGLEFTTTAEERAGAAEMRSTTITVPHIKENGDFASPAVSSINSHLYSPAITVFDTTLLQEVIIEMGLQKYVLIQVDLVPVTYLVRGHLAAAYHKDAAQVR